MYIILDLTEIIIAILILVYFVKVYYNQKKL